MTRTVVFSTKSKAEYWGSDALKQKEKIEKGSRGWVEKNC